MIDERTGKIRFSAADAVTSMNLVCGLLSMIMASHGRFIESIWLIVMAMLCDSVDGNIAKMFKSSSEFGRELDSLADMVSFGTAPAFLFASLFIEPFSYWAFTAPAAYTVCAAVRLARFNVKPAKRGYFQGLPSPSGALGSVMFLLAAIHNNWTALPIFPGVALTGMAVLAFLMISYIPYPKPFGAEYESWKPFFALAGTSFLVAWAFFGREVGFLTLMLVYIFGAPFYGLTLHKKAQTALN